VAGEKIPNNAYDGQEQEPKWEILI
jgi:hypothetical protein